MTTECSPYYEKIKVYDITDNLLHTTTISQYNTGLYILDIRKYGIKIETKGGYWIQYPNHMIGKITIERIKS